MEKLKYWLGLSSFAKFGPARFKKLKKYFPGMETAFQASAAELEQAGIEKNIAQEFAAARLKIDLNKIIDQLAEEEIKAVVIDDPLYPKLLTQIYDPPPILYYKGEFNAADEFCLAVVGTRKFTAYGKQVTENLVRALVKTRLAIVSGLAFGIDTIAHLAAIDAGGRTIAVLGSGLDKQNLYPSQNRYLVEKIIAKGGLILSEFPVGSPPLKHHFPQRNRVISGLSLGVLVVEAGEKSGALITAKFALEQNREVFAVPGSINSPYSSGPNNLIKLGGKAVTDANDIIETFDLARISVFAANKKTIPESKEEEIVLAILTSEPMHLDEVVRLTKLNTSIINSTLTIMEMKGMVRNLGGMQYILI